MFDSMLRQCHGLKAGVVTPPFLYGARSPLVAGIIRRNDEISDESKKVIEKSFFNRNPFLLDRVHVDAFEVVSDDSIHRAHDPTHLEAGVGITLTTSVKIGDREIPCAVVMNCLHVGVRNDFKKYHANQARLICQDFAIESVGVCGLVLSVGDDVISDRFRDISRIGRVHLTLEKKNADTQYAIEKISNEEKRDIFNRYLTFPNVQDSLETISLIDKSSDSVVCGISVVPGTDRFTDAFVTMDCPSGSERQMIQLLASKITTKRTAYLEFATSDKQNAKVFGEHDSMPLSAMPVGLTESEQAFIVRNPIVTSGMFHHLFDPLDYS